MTKDELSLCNCAACENEVVGERSAAQADRWFPSGWPADFPSRVEGRINGRPYCGHCLSVIEKKDQRADDRGWTSRAEGSR